MGGQRCSPAFSEDMNLGMLKDKTISLRAALALCFFAAAAGGSIAHYGFGWRSRDVHIKLKEIDKLVSDKYIGELDTGQAADYAAVGYMAGVNDKWSSYIPADEYEEYDLRNEGKSCGIGVSVVTSDGTIRVSRVYDGSPAEDAGIERKDHILGAEGLTVEKNGANEVIDAIRGEEGKPVKVTVQKASSGEIMELTMTRAIVEQKMAWGEELGSGIGYIRIENFHVGSAAQFNNAVGNLTAKGIKSLIIDVRHNGGGRVKEMSEMLDPLLPEGLIMTLTTKDGRDTFYSSDKEMLDIPLFVLIDEDSISAAEFFGAALQEYERAVLVGAHTTGKGRAQQTFRLSDGSAVNLSIEQYFTPKGNSLENVGIAPDEEVALTEKQKEDFFFLEHDDDPQLKKAWELAFDAQN